MFSMRLNETEAGRIDRVALRYGGLSWADLLRMLVKRECDELDAIEHEHPRPTRKR